MGDDLEHMDVADIYFYNQVNSLTRAQRDRSNGTEWESFQFNVTFCWLSKVEHRVKEPWRQMKMSLPKNALLQRNTTERDKETQRHIYIN